MAKRLAPVCFIILLAAAVAAQEAAGSRTRDARESSIAATASDEAFRQLLNLPAPMPLSSESKREEPSKKTRPDEFFEERKPPTDDAPTGDLLDY